MRCIGNVPSSLEQPAVSLERPVGLPKSKNCIFQVSCKIWECWRLDQVFLDLYNPPELDQTCHASIISHEQRYLEVNHAAVGSWLLTQWNFPDRLRLAVAGSDDPSRIPPQDERAKFAYCVSLSGKLQKSFYASLRATISKL